MLAGFWSPNQRFQVLYIPFVASHQPFSLIVCEARGDALQDIVRKNGRLTICTKWPVAHDSLEENRTEKKTVS